MKNISGDVSHSSFSTNSSPSLPLYLSSTFPIPLSLFTACFAHLSLLIWLDQIGGFWVLVVAFRWWVLVVELNRWPALVVGFFRCLLDPFGGGFWCLLDQFNGEIWCLLGLFGGWVS